MIIEKILLLLYLTVLCGTCEIINETIPAPGTCAGPTERARLLLANIRIFNRGCNASQVPITLVDASNYKCGQCNPGTSGFDDPYKLCAVNEYCNDDGECTPLVKHPLYGAPCPFEPGLPDPKYGYCGPMRCFHHKCLPCLDDQIDFSDGCRCRSNQWTYDVWAYEFPHDPTSQIYFYTAIGLIIYFTFSFLSECGIGVACYVSQRMKK